MPARRTRLKDMSRSDNNSTFSAFSSSLQASSSFARVHLLLQARQSYEQQARECDVDAMLKFEICDL